MDELIQTKHMKVKFPKELRFSKFEIWSKLHYSFHRLTHCERQLNRFEIEIHNSNLIPCQYLNFKWFKSNSIDFNFIWDWIGIVKLQLNNSNLDWFPFVIPNKFNRNHNLLFQTEFESEILCSFSQNHSKLKFDWHLPKSHYHLRHFESWFAKNLFSVLFTCTY